MRMFLSVSGYSSELSIANHSSRPTVPQLKCVSDTISKWFENHQPQKTEISIVIYASFIQNSNQMASRLTTTTSFFQLLQISSQRSSFSAHRAALITKTDLIFPAFSSRFSFCPKNESSICNLLSETKDPTWNRHSSHIVLTPINRLCRVDGSSFKTKTGIFSFY